MPCCSISGDTRTSAGIGIRVETNSSGEFEVEHVHRNGAAERNGNVSVGDIIDTIDGRPVNGLKLLELGVSQACHMPSYTAPDKKIRVISICFMRYNNTNDTFNSL